jgi:hypothetical protein
MRTIILLTVFIMGCATVPNYQRAGENGMHRVGYTEQKVGKNRYRIHYLGTDSKNAYNGVLKRAKELAQEHKFNYFELEDKRGGYESGFTAHYVNVSSHLSLPEYEATVIFRSKRTPASLSINDID